MVSKARVEAGPKLEGELAFEIEGPTHVERWDELHNRSITGVEEVRAQEGINRGGSE